MAGTDHGDLVERGQTRHVDTRDGGAVRTRLVRVDDRARIDVRETHRGAPHVAADVEDGRLVEQESRYVVGAAQDHGETFSDARRLGRVDAQL